MDGDPSTAWTVEAFDDPRAQHLDVALAHPVTTDRVTLVQPLSPPNERYVTRATLRFDHGPSVPVTLGPSSRVATGQTVTFPGRTFQRLSVVIDATNYGPRADFSGVSGVGFAEVRIGAERVDEVVRLPTRPLSSLAGAASLDHRLVVLLSRSRANPGEPYKRDEETAMSRSFTLPAGRSFSLAGTAPHPHWWWAGRPCPAAASGVSVSLSSTATDALHHGREGRVPAPQVDDSVRTNRASRGRRWNPRPRPTVGPTTDRSASHPCRIAVS